MTVGATSRSYRQVAGDPLTEKESEESTPPFFKNMSDFFSKIGSFFSFSQTSSHRYRPNFSSSNKQSIESKRISNLEHGTWNAMGYRRIDNNYFNR